MEKATFVNAFYIDSSTITHQGKRSSINRYLNKGYYIKENRNGYWVLTKPASVKVTLKDSDGELYHFNMKNDILEYYSRTRISQSLFTRFNKDATSGKIQFYMEDGSYSFE